MVAFTFKDLLNGGPASYLTGITDIDIRQTTQGQVLYASSGPEGGISSYQLTASGAQFLGRDAFQPGQIQATTGRTAEITLNGQSLLVTLGRHDTTPQCFDLNAAGQITGTAQLTANGGFPAAIVSLSQVTVGGQDYLYASHFGMTGITVYKSVAGGLQQIGHVGDTGAGPQSADLVAMHSVDIGANSYLLALSATENALISYRLDAGGLPIEVDRIDATTGLSIAAPTALVEAVVDGVHYVVVAAASSGSLSVLELGSDGVLTPTDHVVDDLNTRFQSVSALESITIDGRTYLVAGGGDDGLSLFTLLPGGRLLHLAQIADSNAMALSNISALSLSEIDGVIHVFASGEGAEGITHLTVNPGALGQTLQAGNGGEVISGTNAGEVLIGGTGNDRLRSQGGDDILIDGEGSDLMRGGGGADTFVFVADGVRDTVEDFQLGIDRLDLSGLGWIYSLSQLTIVETSWGAKIFAGNEEIRLYSADGNPLDPTAFTLGDFVNLTHYPAFRTAPQGVVGGTPGDDHLLGSSGNDTLSGLAGDDLLEGDHGNDTLIGGTGADTLMGGANEDRLDGGDGNDALYGESGRDTLIGGGGADMLDGGWFSDWLYGGEGNDTLIGDGGVDRLFGDNGNDLLRGDGGNDILRGGAGNDDLRGGTSEDLLEGGGGNDTLSGESGYDTLIGGGGADMLDGGWFNDWLYGEADADLLRGDGGVDRLFGGTGDDTLEGGDGNDVLWGDGGHDVLRGGANEDWMNGGTGDDSLYGDSGHDSLHGAAGDDLLNGGWFNDWLYGGVGDDSLLGDGGVDRLFGGADDDTLEGGNGNDVLWGDGGHDVLRGGANEDWMNGGTGRDSLYGGNGHDSLHGAAGDDVLSGGIHNDWLYGGFGRDLLAGDGGVDRLFGDAGNDTLLGGNGDDILFGGANNDRLDGGGGHDLLSGGGFADTFVFQGRFGHDSITDFDAHNNVEDIDLSGVATITGYTDLANNHMTQVGADVVIDDHAGSTITVLNTSIGDMDAFDFSF